MGEEKGAGETSSAPFSAFWPEAKPMSAYEPKGAAPRVGREYEPTQLTEVRLNQRRSKQRG